MSNEADVSYIAQNDVTDLLDRNATCSYFIFIRHLHLVCEVQERELAGSVDCNDDLKSGVSVTFDIWQCSN